MDEKKASSPVSLPISVPLAKHRELVNIYGAGDIAKIVVERVRGIWAHTIKWTAEGIEEKFTYRTY